MKTIHQILKEEQEISTVNTSRLILANDFKNLYLTSADGDLFLTVDSLIRLNNLVTVSRNIGLRTCNVKPAGFKRQYMEANKIEAVLYGLLMISTIEEFPIENLLYSFLTKYIPSQMETIELATFCLRTR